MLTNRGVPGSKCLTTNSRTSQSSTKSLDANVADSFTVFSFPETHRRRLRTSNLMERISKELKRRTRVATLFPNEASLLRLVSAVLMEISEEWETEKTYLRMENLTPPEQD
jgi:putative transposase